MVKDGGPAFPVIKWTVHGGMSLRDYFAAAALEYFQPEYDEKYMAVEDYADIARGAYKVADAMLAEREKETK